MAMTRLRVLPGLLALMLAIACSGSSDGDAAGEESMDVDGVRAMAAAAMADVDSALFTIGLEGADVYIDDADLIQFRSAEGRYAAPGSADAVVSVVALGLATEVGAVAIDGDVWITNPLTGSWEAAPDSLAFDPATIFDAEIGLAGLIADGLSDAVLASPEPDAEGRWHISAGVDPARVSTLTAGLVHHVDNVDLWFDEATGRLTDVTFDVGTGEGGTSWRLTLFDYGTDVTVEQPELG